MLGFRGAIKEELAASLAILSNVEDESTSSLLEALAGADKVFVSGAGRTGCIAKCFAMRLMQLGFSAHVVGETVTPRINKGDLLIACSMSGKTQTTCIIGASAARIGAKVVVLTSDRSSPLAEIARLMVVLPAPPSQPGGLATAAELALLIYLDGIVAAVMEERSISGEELLQRHTNLE